MYNSNSLEKHFRLVDTLVLSTHELVINLKKNEAIDELIYSTASEVFKFISKIMALSPDILITNFQVKVRKHDIIDSFDKVINTWSEFFIDRNEFYYAWEDFYFLWNKYQAALEKISVSENTIFLSLN